jgi:hypothetical protein
LLPDWLFSFNKLLLVHAIDLGWYVVCTVLDLKTFVTALGTEKIFEDFEVEDDVEEEALESETVTILDEGVDGDDFGLKFEGVENSKFELVVKLALVLWGYYTMWGRACAIAG